MFGDYIRNNVFFVNINKISQIQIIGAIFQKNIMSHHKTNILGI